MALSPREAIAAHLAALEPQRQKLEAFIDSGLARGGRTFSTDGYDREAVIQIIDIYRLRSWRVEHVIDQRDGNYLRFEE